MGENIMLLLVDDEEEVTKLLSLRLGKRGYGCICAKSGEEALTALEQGGPEIVILDVKMPGMGGVKALECIKERWAQIPVILLSGHADMQTAVQAMQTGAFGYLMKPVELDELIFKIEDAVAQLKLEAITA